MAVIVFYSVISHASNDQTIILHYNSSIDYHGLTLKLNTQIEWQEQAGAYTLVSNTSLGTKSLIQLRSQGIQTPDLLLPTDYSEVRSNKTQLVNLNHQTKQITVNNNVLSSPWLPKTQDLLSLPFSLGLQLRTHAQLQSPPKNISLPVSNRQHLYIVDFINKGRKTVQIKQHTLPVVVLQNATQQDKLTLSIWLIVDESSPLHYLPARIEINDPAAKVSLISELADF